jgi:2-dehydro-3-deoxyphosphogluconate aldolase / (4S)-4-hydroxy-2-oxoglutarate aldolase
MARFDRLTVLNTILADGLIPLFYQPDLDLSNHLASALFRGGAHLLEFTNRGDFAIEVFSGLVKAQASAHPEQIIGVGTVEDAPTAALFIAHGANFVVGPSFSEAVARICNRHKIAYIPGCGTVTEIATAEEFGAEIIKLFPAEVAQPSFVKAILGPRPWTRLLPTGGVLAEEANLRTWFEAGVACVGLGSQLSRSEWVKSRNFDAIEAKVRSTLTTISQIRSTL